MARTGSAKPPSPSDSGASSSAANVGFDAKVPLAADNLRSNMGAAEYKHVVLGLLFLATSPLSEHAEANNLQNQTSATARVLPPRLLTAEIRI